MPGPCAVGGAGHGRPAAHFPGVSVAQFNPIEASRCWESVIRREKQSRSVHQHLDAYGKLGMPPEWAKSWNPKDDMIPGQQSVMATYRKLGWKVNPVTGQSLPPDPFHRQKREASRRAKEEVAAEKLLHQERSCSSLPATPPRAEAWCDGERCHVDGISWNQTPVVKPFRSGKFGAQDADAAVRGVECQPPPAPPSRGRRRPSSAPQAGRAPRCGGGLPSKAAGSTSRAARPQSAPVYAGGAAGGGPSPSDDRRARRRREKVASIVREVVAHEVEKMLRSFQGAPPEKTAETTERCQAVGGRRRPASAPCGGRRRLTV
eukprot:TRINITY_DN13957_c0_g1_i1.p1 TRINITY_DN13957_c0_g1~~TRINITY_DN13957_c0_g1_i1.p1  ORF type:complete len:345 (-),score=49.79 TRINITY_DN13957_c0_g1_i1:340-1293(-)